MSYGFKVVSFPEVVSRGLAAQGSGMLQKGLQALSGRLQWLTSGLAFSSKSSFPVCSEAFRWLSRPESVARVRLRTITGPTVDRAR